MTTEQEIHLQQIKLSFVESVDAKYRQGVKEHGGNLFEKSLQHLLVKESINEAIDFYVYMFTLKSQVNLIRYWCEQAGNSCDYLTSILEIEKILNGTIQTDKTEKQNEPTPTSNPS